VRQPIQKRPRRDDDRGTTDIPSVHEQNAPYAAILDNQSRYFRLLDRKVRFPFQNLFHAHSIQLLIALGPRRPNGWTPARIQKPELDTNRIRNLTHYSAQGIDLTH
jgi:hypothetical protein